MDEKMLEIVAEKLYRWKRLPDGKFYTKPFSEAPKNNRLFHLNRAKQTLKTIDPLIRQDERERVMLIIEKEYPGVSAWHFWQALKASVEKEG